MLLAAVGFLIFAGIGFYNANLARKGSLAEVVIVKAANCRKGSYIYFLYKDKQYTLHSEDGVCKLKVGDKLSLILTVSNDGQYRFFHKNATSYSFSIVLLSIALLSLLLFILRKNRGVFITK